MNTAKMALITGAAGGLGASFAKQLAKDGYDLLLADRDAAPLERVVAELRDRVRTAANPVVADLSTSAGTGHLINAVEHHAPLDLLINNAGFGTIGHFADVDPQKHTDMLHVHIEAAVRLTRSVIPKMMERQRGAIINVASAAALLPDLGANAVLYCASKAFLVAFSQALQQEVAHAGIRIQALCPGYTRTGFHHTKEYKAFESGKIPEFLWSDPDQVVRDSLDALPNGPLIVIPGRRNRIVKRLMSAPLIRGWLRAKQIAQASSSATTY